MSFYFSFFFCTKSNLSYIVALIFVKNNLNFSKAFVLLVNFV